MCVWYSKNRLNLFYQLELWAIWPTGLPVWLNLKLSISLFFYQFFQTLVLQRPPRNKHRSYMVCAFIVQVIHKNCRDLLKRSLKSVTLTFSLPKLGAASLSSGDFCCQVFKSKSVIFCSFYRCSIKPCAR